MDDEKMIIVTPTWQQMIPMTMLKIQLRKLMVQIIQNTHSIIIHLKIEIHIIMIKTRQHILAINLKSRGY